MAVRKVDKEARDKATEERKKAANLNRWRNFAPVAVPGEGPPIVAQNVEDTVATSNSANAGATVSTAPHSDVTPTTAAIDEEERDSSQDLPPAQDFNTVIINNPAVIGTVNPEDAEANLDYYEDEAKEKNSDDFDDDTIQGVQQQYVAAIQRQVQSEVSKDNPTINKWLLKYLKENDWRIRKENYRWFINMYNKSRENKEDKLKVANKAYYRDVLVWLPDLRWDKKKYMPYCPCCKSNASVGPHCFRDNHAGRVIVDLTETYYAVSRRYICRKCEDDSKQAKKRVEDFAKEREGVTVNVELDENKYTFMGWNQSSLPLLPNNKGSKFPAFLTWRAGVDKKVITKLKQDVNSGKAFERISKDLLEYHTEQHTDLNLEYEYEIKEKRAGNIIKQDYPIFSTFRDAKLYRGLVPTGAYLQHVYELHHESIRAYLIKEVKKRGSNTLHWDVSYKEAKHISRVRGQPVFKGLVTAMNEFGEIRIQFHVYTDSHEQMTAALEAFMRTTKMLGHPPVQYFWTDNPGGDGRYFLKQIPSLQEKQDELNTLCNDNNDDTKRAAELPFYDYNTIDVHLVETKDECNQKINAILGDMNQKTIGLDAEWNVEEDRFGLQKGSSKVLTIQLAYRDCNDKIQVFIFKTEKWKSLIYLKL